MRGHVRSEMYRLHIRAFVCVSMFVHECMYGCQVPNVCANVSCAVALEKVAETVQLRLLLLLYHAIHPAEGILVNLIRQCSLKSLKYRRS